MLKDCYDSRLCSLSLYVLSYLLIVFFLDLLIYLETFVALLVCFGRVIFFVLLDFVFVLSTPYVRYVLLNVCFFLYSLCSSFLFICVELYFVTLAVILSFNSFLSFFCYSYVIVKLIPVISVCLGVICLFFY